MGAPYLSGSKMYGNIHCRSGSKLLDRKIVVLQLDAENLSPGFEESYDVRPTVGLVTTRCIALDLEREYTRRGEDLQDVRWAGFRVFNGK